MRGCRAKYFFHHVDEETEAQEINGFVQGHIAEKVVEPEFESRHLVPKHVLSDLFGNLIVNRGQSVPWLE